MITPEMLDLTGKVAIVTGSGRGLGRAIAVGLARFGATTVVVDRDEAAAREARHEVAAVQPKSIMAQCDVSIPDEVTALFATVLDRLETIDILVNNAGAWEVSTLLDTTPESFTRHVNANLLSAFLCSTAAARHWSEAKKGGAIVNIASTEGIRGCPYLGAYAAAKAGLINLTKTMAAEWGPLGIKVNAVAPDYTPTPGVMAHGTFTPQRRKRVAGAIPLRRLGAPDDTAGAVLYLVSGLASWVSGDTIVVDGGSIASARVEGPIFREGDVIPERKDDRR